MKQLNLLIETILVVLLLLFGTSSLNANNPLESKSFTLTSAVHHLSETANTSIYLEERYSHRQARGLVDYKSRGLREWHEEYYRRVKDKNELDYDAGSYFYDDYIQLSLLQGFGTIDCTTLSWPSMTQLMGLEFMQDIKLSNHNHLVGPSRLLFYVLSNRNRLLVDLKNTFKRIKNVPVIAYTITLMTTTKKDETDVKLNVYFDDYSVAQDSHNSIPIRIEFMTGGDQQQYGFIDYSAVRFLDDSHEARRMAQQQHGNLRSSDQVIFDPFIMDPLGRCATLLAPTRGHVLFHSRDQTKTRFSFNALVDHSRKGADSSGQFFNVRVNYDGQLDMMRLDFGKKQTTNHLSSARQILNFKRNKQYHILSKRDSHYMVANLLKMSSSAEAGQSNGVQSAWSQCVVTPIERITNDLSYKRGFHLDQLIAGHSQTGFIYLGKAQVRGMPCLVYESTESRPPIWLDQPVDYKTGSGLSSSFTRREANVVSSGPEEEQESVLRTLVYLSEDEMNDLLVMIEIYRTDPLSVVTYEKWTITVREFTWHLNNVVDDGTDNRPMFEMFSLEQHCAQESSDQIYQSHNTSEVQLLLETTGRVYMGPFKQPAANERNLAILSALQKDLGLSANMIYDLETSLIDATGNKVLFRGRSEATNSGVQTSSSQDELTRHLQLLVKFRAATQLRTYVDLIFVGKGKHDLSLGSLYYLVPSFQACFMLASHRRVDLFFGFDSRHRHCFISVKSITKSDASTTTLTTNEVLGFVLDKEHGDLEIYRTQHQQIDTRHPVDGWTKEETFEGDRIRLIDTKLQLADANGQNELEFQVKRVNVRRHEPRVGLEDQAKVSETIQKLQGFGLIDGEHLKATPVHSTFMNPFGGDASGSSKFSYDAGQVTFEQCQAVCLADLKCQSFSVCIRGSEIVCILSKMSYESPEIVNLILQASKSVQRGVNFAISFNDMTVRLVRHANCAIYNKKYLLFFKPIPERIETTLFNTRLQRVSGLEECAEICSRKNLRAIGSHMDRVADSLSALGSPVIETSAIDPKVLSSIRGFDLKQTLLQQICFKFLYLDRFSLAANQEMTNTLTEYSRKCQQATYDQTMLKSDGQNDDKDDDDDWTGYCGIPVRQTKEDPPLDGIHKMVRVDQYDFKMDLFYEEQYGVSLLESNKSPEEREAYGLMKSAEMVKENTLETMRSFLRRGENSQLKQVGDKATCALLCIMQALGPWPSCRSFDIIVDKNKDNQSSLYCLLNSITLNQVISQERYDLINTQDERKSAESVAVQRWHYEPRPGFVLETCILDADKELWTDYFEKFTGQQPSYLSHILAGILFIAIIYGGFLVGTMLFHRVLRGPLSNYLNNRRESHLSQVNVLSNSVTGVASFEIEEVDITGNGDNNYKNEHNHDDYDGDGHNNNGNS